MQCVFHREQTSEVKATYRRCFSVPIKSILLLLGSSNEGIVVQHSPISDVAYSTSVVPIDTVEPSTVAPFTNLQCCAFHECCTNGHCCAFYMCTIHQSPLLCLLQGLHQSLLLRLLQVLHQSSLLHFFSFTVIQCCFFS